VPGITRDYIPGRRGEGGTPTHLSSTFFVKLFYLPHKESYLSSLNPPPQQPLTGAVIEPGPFCTEANGGHVVVVGVVEHTGDDSAHGDVFSIERTLVEVGTGDAVEESRLLGQKLGRAAHVSVSRSEVGFIPSPLAYNCIKMDKERYLNRHPLG